jgi:hypothetical protein
VQARDDRHFRRIIRAVIRPFPVIGLIREGVAIGRPSGRAQGASPSIVTPRRREGHHR